MKAQLAVMRLISLAREEAYRKGCSKITAIHVRLGAQESVKTDDLLKTFSELKNSHPFLEKASLVIKRGRGLARCRYCGYIFEVSCFRNRCKQCGCQYLEFVVDRGISLERVEGEG